MISPRQLQPNCSPDEHPRRDGRPALARSFSKAAPAVARVFVAAGDVQRLRLLVLLLDGPMSIRDLARGTGRPITLVSQQVRVLRDAEVVKVNREGRHHLYSIVDGITHGLLETCIGHAIKSRPVR